MEEKLQKYRELLKDSNFNIIDVGCGPGYFLRCLEEWYPKLKYLQVISIGLLSNLQKKTQEKSCSFTT
jgi:trans-aconitate methyltransferase